MSHRVNLGQACFQTAASPLKLQLTATGHFKLPINCSNQIPQIQDIQLLYLLSAWVTEAPELELRLHFDIKPRLEWTLSSLVSSLEERMCSSKLRNLGGHKWLSHKLPDIWTLQKNALTKPNHQSKGPVNFEKPARGSPANQPSRDIPRGN
ncbi:hypothetical protein N7481_001143 [Penicillium waksmanii]|uniref:uncharacterized protein n=1 Tax=Penicillium waksmanii TaxID=69791 RepID=UPI002549714E|nr:uncharacterized protein N7481_001143 [Penicillium waksmanii]KAJ6000734.1 hypothetical protein N7481_001143 [Penicillium waksmanii]